MRAPEKKSTGQVGMGRGLWEEVEVFALGAEGQPRDDGLVGSPSRKKEGDRSLGIDYQGCRATPGNGRAP